MIHYDSSSRDILTGHVRPQTRKQEGDTFVMIGLIFTVVFLFGVVPVPGLLAQTRSVGLIPVSHPKYSDFYDRSYALVVGIDDYESSSVPKLRYATNDARSISALLESDFGFNPQNVITLLDSSASRKGIMLAFDRLRRKAKSDDRVLVFFAGHGETIQMPDGRQKGYILPYDVDTQDLITTAISTDQLNEISQLMPAKHLFFIMDACYGGLIFSRAVPLSPSATDYLSVISQRMARKALTGGGQDQTVQDNGPGGHSVFTYYLITGLKTGAADLNGDGMITSAELDAYIAPRVTAETNKAQTPEYGILGGDTGGDFVFIPSDVNPPNMALASISSNPPGADVIIDGKPAGVTPLNLPLSPAQHFVSVTKEGYSPSGDSVLIAMNTPNAFNYTLSPVVIPVNVTANVDGADVYLDTKLVTRVVNRKASIMVPAGTHTIELRKSRYASASSTVDFEQGGNYSLPFLLDRAFTTLSVNVSPDSAAVYIDGSLRLLGSGSADVKIGSHDITVVKEGYETYDKKVAAAGSGVNLDVSLTPIVGTFQITSNPAGAVISVDNMSNSVTPGSVQLAYGRHEIEVDKPGYKPVLLDEVVSKTAVTSKSVDLALTAQSVADEIIRTKWSSVNSMRWSNITLAVLSGAAAVALAENTNTAYNRYMDARTQSDISGTWDRYKYASMNRNVAIGAAVVFGLASIYSIFKGVDNDEAYKIANDFDSRGTYFSTYSSVDDSISPDVSGMVDFSGGYGLSPLPGFVDQVTIIPLGLTLSLPLGQSVFLRLGGGLMRMVPGVDQMQAGIDTADQIFWRVNLLSLKAGLGVKIGKIRLSGDYVYVLNPDMGPITKLVPPGLFEFTLEGEALPGFYTGISMTAVQSQRLVGISKDPGNGSSVYQTASAGLLLYPSVIIGFNL